MCVLAALLVWALTQSFRLQAQATLVLQPGNTGSTLAGSGSDNHTVAGPALTSALGSPGAIAYDAAGNLYIADKRNQQISRIDTAGQMTVLSGTGRQGFTGDGGAAANAEWNTPDGIAVDVSGNVYVADTGNARVRRIAAVTGTVTTVAGSSQAGFSGDGGPATAARLRSPTGLAVDSTGALYIADVGNHRVRKLNPDGTIVTVAGNGLEGQDGDGGPATAASLGAPSALALLPDGRLLIADREAKRLRTLQADGTIAAYTAGPVAMRQPAGLAVDTSGSLYLADAAASAVVQIGSDGSSRYAGSGEQGVFAAGAPLTTALNAPAGLATRANGDLAIADTHNHQVQRISLPSLNFGAVPAGSRSQAQTVTLQNGGTTGLTVMALDLPGGFVQSSQGSTCKVFPFSLPAAQTCSIALNFAPTIQGPGDATARVRVQGGAPQALLLVGTGIAGGTLSSSITSLRTDGNIAYAGSPIALTATVSGSLLASPIGNVTFLDGSVSVGSSALSAGQATLSTSALSSGPHTLRATYSGDATYSTSTSAATALTIVPAPDFTMTATAASYSGKAGGSMSVPLTLLPVNGTLNRPVQFAVSGLPVGATATFAPAVLTLGGDTAVVTLTVQMPTTLSRNDLPHKHYGTLACVLLAGALLYRRRAVAGVLTIALVCIAITGCGSGYRGGSAADTSAASHTYSGVVTATTTGVLGAPLAHSTSIGFVISP
ncbi:MAG: Ig-like domain repeat protein [Janthinobacterium lividum]